MLISRRLILSPVPLVLGVLLAASPATLLAQASVELPAAPQPSAGEMPAQPASDGQVAVPVPAPAPLDETALVARLAQRVVRTALLDLRVTPEPTPEDFTITRALLEHAATLAPSDPEIVRAIVLACSGAQDEAGVIEATRRLVRLDPQDTVAQLRLLSHNLRSMQTAEQRAAAYDRLLGKAGDALDASVRSRLALDAALLAREMGNERGFVDRLTRATQLDASNKDAALLAYSYGAQSLTDPRERFELLSNLLLADPLDPALALQMRDELARGGAFVQAERFHGIALRAGGAPEGLVERLEGLTLRWRTAGPGEVLKDLNKDLAILRDRQRRLLEGTDLTRVGDLREPEELRLPIELEELRLCAALASGNNEGVIASMVDLSITHGEAAARAIDPTQRATDVTDEQAQATAQQHAVELAVWRMLSGVDAQAGMDAVPTLLEAFPTKDQDPRAPTLTTLLKYAQGDHAGVLEATRETTVDEPFLLMARGQAMAKDAAQAKQAATVLRSIERALPVSALGAWAGTRATQLDITSVQVEAATLTGLARQVPSWVDAMATRPTVFQGLTADHERGTASPSEGVATVFRLRNVATVPLGVGDQRPISSRVMITPRVDVTPATLTHLLRGEVVELDQRLRLMPGEELRVTLRPDTGLVSWVVGSASIAPSRVRLRCVQAFMPDAEGILRAGPGGIDTSTGVLERAGLPAAQASPAQLAEQLRGAYASQLPDLLIAARAVIMQDEIARRAPTGDRDALTRPNGSPPQETLGIIAALAESYPGWSSTMRALALTELPFAGDVPAMRAFDDVALMEQEPSVLALALATRLSDAASPALGRASESASSTAQALSRLYAQRLQRGGPTLASRGLLSTATDVSTLSGPPTR